MERNEGRDFYDNIILALTKHPILQAVMLLICTAIGVFAFILPSIRDYAPIAREDAETHVGCFEDYQSYDDYAAVKLSDGAWYQFDPHALPQTVEDALEATEPGTELSLTVNPKAGVVIELFRGTEELLNFESSQVAIQEYHRGYIRIGALFIVLPFVLIVLFRLIARAKKKEAERRAAHEAWQPKTDSGKNSPTLREADMTKRGRILLEATIDLAKPSEGAEQAAKDTPIVRYAIVYRRLKAVNELIVNGIVYDEMKAVIEVEHVLSAVIDGHLIEAGVEDEVYSFIRVDGDTVKTKRRII